jgi:DNA-binding transcriptional MerR regulator
MSDWSKRTAELFGERKRLEAAGVPLDEIRERLRRMRIHLVKPAAAEWQKRLDEETYGGKTVSQTTDNKREK